MEKNKDFKYELTAKEQIDLGFSALGDIYSLYNSLASSNNEAANYRFSAFMDRFNAATLRQDAQSILDAANREENIAREAGLRERGEQITAMGSSGFSVSSKSYQSMINETDRNIENNVAYIRENAMAQYAKQMYQARGMEIQAGYEKKAAKIAKRAGLTKSLLSAVSAASKFGFAGYYGSGNTTTTEMSQKQPPVPAHHPWR